MHVRLLPLLASAALLASACAPTTSPNEWPAGPVRVIAATAAGSGSDAVIRLLAPHLSARWRQPITIDNRPGDDGVVAVQAFLAGNDAHTLLFTPSGFVTLTPALRKSLPYDPSRDLMPIAAAVDGSIGIAVAAHLPVRSIADLIRFVSEPRAEEVVWASAPGLPEVLFRAFLQIEKIPMRRLVYPDPSAAVADLNARRIHIVIASLATLAASIRTGTARLIAVTNSARAQAYPDVPTAAESGYPQLAVDGQWGFFGRRDLPLELRENIARDVRDVLDTPEVANELATRGLRPAAGTPDTFAEALNRQRQQLAGLIRALGEAGISLDPR